MREERFAKLCENVEKHRDEVFDAHDYFWAHPATGFREWEVSDYLSAAFEKLGYTLKRAGDIPGFYADIDTGRPGPRVVLMGEMDCLIIPSHPDARPETGCVHACGHHAQSAALLAVAAALKEPGALDGLSGSIRLMAVPAEELTEVPYREELRRRGVIRFYGGKQEFLARGYLDGCDMAMMVHTSYGEGLFEFPNRGDNGLLIKTAVFTGRAGHSGYSPQLTVNAMAAATLAVSSMNAVRETFRDDDYYRIQMTNLTGDNLRCSLELKLRGATAEKIAMLNRRVNRALAGAAASIGASVEISDRAGYSPMINDPDFAKVFCRAANLLDTEHTLVPGNDWTAACTDMGDVSALMPIIHPYSMGAAGPAHTDTYRIKSREMACINSAKAQILTLEFLLENSAAEARQIIAGYKPVYQSRNEYVKALESYMTDRALVQTNEDGSVTLLS